ncbi:MAG: site-specific integrase [Chlamydiia bacterium]|nr:site-specific integrase [Chlamydiia bacterium]
MNIPPGIDRFPLQDGTCHYRVRIRIKGHKPVSKNFKSLTHAKRWKRVTEGQIEKGLYVSFSKADQYTVANALRRYRKEILPLKTNDGDNVARHIDRWEKELGHLKLSRLNQSVIAEARDRMLSEEIRPGILRSNSTVSRYLASLSHVLSTAVREWQWINENPCLKVRKPKSPPGRVRYLSREELSKIIDACKRSQNEDLCLIFLIALTTGARKSEILGLKGKDIDLENRVFLLFDTKNGDNRVLPMSDQVFEIMQHRSVEESGFIFPSPTDPNQPVCIRSAWELAVERAGLQDFRFHDIRHTTASYLTMDGTSTREVAEVLGHKSLQTTKRYSHLANAHKRKLVNRMEGLIREKS